MDVRPPLVAHPQSPAPVPPRQRPLHGWAVERTLARLDPAPRIARGDVAGAQRLADEREIRRLVGVPSGVPTLSRYAASAAGFASSASPAASSAMD